VISAIGQVAERGVADDQAGSTRPMPHVPGVSHSYYQVGEIRMHVAEAGEGPPVVLLHGWPEHWYVWRDVIPTLSKRYRVICPDLRGFGWSSVPRRGYDKEALARDVLALLDQMGVERCYAAGHDWGGWAGFLMSQFEPHRVKRYIALNIAVPFQRIGITALANQWRFWYQPVVGTPFLGSWLVRRMGRGRPSATLRWAGLERPQVWNAEEREIFLSQLREPERARASMLLYRAFQSRELRWLVRGRYRRLGLKVPALVLHGALDKILRPAHLVHSKKVAPHVEIEYVEDCGHFIIDERPDLVGKRMLQFFGAGELSTTASAR
jgi:pimeloyl-ACP methyl ester carboxylesterase